VIVVKVLAFAAGLWVLQAVLRSAVRTVVVPRAEPVLLPRLLFLFVRALYTPLAIRHHDPERRHAVLARFAPMALLLLAFTWAAVVILAFVPMYWAVSDIAVPHAFKLSGSSVTTLGFAAPPNPPAAVLAVVEALLGLGVVALLIAYLPTIYGHFSNREEQVLKFEVRAGSPPTPSMFLVRLHAIGWFDRLGLMWEPWETWFEELQESHTSQASLAFFRSQNWSNSWVVTAGAVLDTAAISEAAIDQPTQPEAALMMRAGFLALRDIAAFYGLRIDPEPAPNAPISVSRAEFEEVLDGLELRGLPIATDREKAWRDFAGWRVNYDEALLALCALVQAPTASWSSDRCGRFHRPTVRNPRTWRIDPLDAPPSW
jgi:hypothetical protein